MTLNQHRQLIGLAKSHQHQDILEIQWQSDICGWFHIEFKLVDNSTKCKWKLDVELTSVPSGGWHVLLPRSSVFSCNVNQLWSARQWFVAWVLKISGGLEASGSRAIEMATVPSHALTLVFSLWERGQTRAKQSWARKKNDSPWYWPLSIYPPLLLFPFPSIASACLLFG